MRVKLSWKKEEGKMRSKEGVPLLLFMAILFLHLHHLHATSAGRVQNEGERGGAIAGLDKFSHRGIGGGGNGKGNGNEGSHSPDVQGGGGGVTPLYAAAAGGGNNHHPHHGGGDRVVKGGAGVEALAVAIFAWFFLCNNQDL